jgi:hypothetical protein
MSGKCRLIANVGSAFRCPVTRSELAAIRSEIKPVVEVALA